MPAEHSPKSWYLIYSKPRQEYIAQENLQRQGYHVFLPEVMERKISSKPKKIISPLFPRYLFIRLDKVSDQWGPIRSTKGVVKIVSFGDQPLVVSDSLINSIETRVSEHGWVEMAEPVFLCGQAVRITRGVMEGYEALFAAPNGYDRVIILLNIIGQQTRVVVPRAYIEALT